MRRSVVGELFAPRRYLHGLRRDAQVARRRRDHVVRGHVLFAVHYLVAFIHRVVAGLRIGYVRYAARRARYQLIARQQFAFGHRHFAVAVGCSVVLPDAVGGLDRDRAGGDLQLTRLPLHIGEEVRYILLRGVFNNGIALHLVVDSTNIGDAAFNYSINRIAFRQSVNIESTLCQCRTIICSAGILCFDSDQLVIRLCIIQVCAVIPVPACKGIACDTILGIAFFGVVQPSGLISEPIACSCVAMNKVLHDKPSLRVVVLEIMFDSVIAVINNAGSSRFTVCICLFTEFQCNTTEVVLAVRDFILSGFESLIAT